MKEFSILVRRPFWLSRAVLSLVVFGCGSSPDPWDSDAAFLGETDSAGVRILTNAERHPTNLFRTSPEPALVLGREISADNFLFNVSGAVALENGTVVVANGGSRELYWYDQEGTLIDRAGGDGEEPGQFLRLTTLNRDVDDRLVVYDRRLRRMSWFSDRGEFVRSMTIPTAQSMSSPIPVGSFDDGAVAVYQGSFALQETGSVRVERLSQPLYRYHADAGVLDTIVQASGAEVMVVPNLGTAGGMVKRRRRFGRTGVYVVWNNLLVVGDNAEYEFRLYDAGGILNTIIRKENTAVVVTLEHLAEVRNTQRDMINDSTMRERVEQALSQEPPPPERMPAFGERILVDSANRLWVSNYQWPLDAPIGWSVFDTKGRLVANVSTPSDEWLAYASDNLVLTIVTDADGREYVRGYGLERVEQPG